MQTAPVSSCRSSGLQRSDHAPELQIKPGNGAQQPLMDLEI